jgi:hypothetical protein
MVPYNQNNSTQSSFVTGAELAVDGGFLAT